MKLVIGGYAQGKLSYVLQKNGVEAKKIWDGMLPSEEESVNEILVLNHLHEWIKTMIIQGKCPEEQIISFVEKYPDSIIICDEIGNGIVPIDPVERDYRERTGRILIELAKRAEEVERVVCGIGQKIK